MILDKKQIKEIIPYSEPFLWVDEVESITEDTITGYKNTSPEDEFFKGHFVGFSIMPGVLVVEGIAQIGTILLRKKMGAGNEKKHLFAYQVRSVFFYKPIFPGDKIKYKVELVRFYGDKVANFKGEAYVGEDRKCEVRFVVAVVDKEEFKEKYGAGGKPVAITELPPLRIGNIFAKYPIIQGGMAVRVSLHNLAGNVAKEGGIGIIAISGMMDPEEVKTEIRKAREIAGPGGVIGVNIMGVMTRFKEMLEVAMQEGIDLVIQGAGFREDIFELGKKYHTPIFCLASSAKVAQRGEQMGATAIVVEGKEAGGHLGFPAPRPFRKTEDVLKEVVEAVKIPVIVAGGIFTGSDIVKMLKIGAKGVQMATRFVSTEECDVHQNFKDVYIKAREEDIVIVPSPAGLPGRAVKTTFIEKVLRGEGPKPDPKECQRCITVCNKKYCILKALENARKGDVENGLVFAGENVWRVKEMTTVKKLIKELVDEANETLKKEPLYL